MSKINPFTVFQTDTGYVTGEHWNAMVDRITALERAWAKADACGMYGRYGVCNPPCPLCVERNKIARAEAEAAVAARAHVCGLQGYDGMRDPPCPGCENMQRAF